jgi:hypothetical protein
MVQVSDYFMPDFFFFYPAYGRAWTANLVFSITPYLFQTREYI